MADVTTKNSALKMTASRNILSVVWQISSLCLLENPQEVGETPETRQDAYPAAWGPSDDSLGERQSPVYPVMTGRGAGGLSGQPSGNSCGVPSGTQWSFTDAVRRTLAHGLALASRGHGRETVPSVRCRSEGASPRRRRIAHPLLEADRQLTRRLRYRLRSIAQIRNIAKNRPLYVRDVRSPLGCQRGGCRLSEYLNLCRSLVDLGKALEIGHHVVLVAVSTEHRSRYRRAEHLAFLQHRQHVVLQVRLVLFRMPADHRHILKDRRDDLRAAGRGHAEFGTVLNGERSSADGHCRQLVLIRAPRAVAKDAARQRVHVVGGKLVDRRDDAVAVSFAERCS